MIYTDLIIFSEVVKFKRAGREARLGKTRNEQGIQNFGRETS
jgi:hypothetical protein